MCRTITRYNYNWVCGFGFFFFFFHSHCYGAQWTLGGKKTRSPDRVCACASFWHSRIVSCIRVVYCMYAPIDVKNNNKKKTDIIDKTTASPLHTIFATLMIHTAPVVQNQLLTRTHCTRNRYTRDTHRNVLYRLVVAVKRFISRIVELCFVIHFHFSYANSLFYFRNMILQKT